jgi:signal transduction histidine kinase
LVIVIIAVVLIVATFEFFSYSTSTIQSSSVDATNTNAQIEVHDLANLLASKLASITSNLVVLSSSHTIKSLNYSLVEPLLLTAEATTQAYTTGYSLTAASGKPIASSNLTALDTALAQGINSSRTSWFLWAESAGTTYANPEFISTSSNNTFLVVSQPVYSNSGTARGPGGTFVGVLASGVSLDNLGLLVKSQLSQQIQGSIGIIDYKGTVLYSASSKSIGENIYDHAIEATVPKYIYSEFYGFVNDSLSGSPALHDFVANGTTVALASDPVTYGQVLGNASDSRLFAAVYVSSPSLLAAGASLVVDQLQLFTAAAFIVIVSAATLGSVSTLRRNRDLSKLVNERTASLEKSVKTAELMQDILTHDIRNYNQISQSNIELLKDDLSRKGGAEVGQDIGLADSALRAIDGSTQLVSRTKFLGSISSLKGTTNLVPMDLDASLRRSAELVEKANPEKKVNISFMTQPGATVKANDLLDQIFTNILSNSVRYTDSDEVQVQITVEPATLRQEKEPKQGWKVVLTDQGRGIPDERKEDLFKRYLKTAHGTGLGMSIVYALTVDLYGGEVKVSDRVQGDYKQGTRFEVWLPKAQGGPAENRPVIREPARIST